MKLWEFENNRNTDNEKLFAAMVREAYPDATLVVAGHHIFYRRDGNDTEEIPSADALIFDHFIAQRVWKDNWRTVLTQLALEPVATRDTLLTRLFEERKQ